MFTEAGLWSYHQLLLFPVLITFFLTSVSFLMDISADFNSPFNTQVPLERKLQEDQMSFAYFDHCYIPITKTVFSKNQRLNK